MQRLGEAFLVPIKDWLETFMREIVRDEVKEIKQQVLPNDGSSIADKVVMNYKEIKCLEQGHNNLQTQIGNIEENIEKLLGDKSES